LLGTGVAEIILDSARSASSNRVVRTRTLCGVVARRGNPPGCPMPREISIGPLSDRCPKKWLPSVFWGFCQLARSTVACRWSRVATRLRQSPDRVPCAWHLEARFRGQSTSEDCLSERRTQPWLVGFDSVGQTERPRQGDGNQGLTRWGQPDQPTRLRTGRSPFDALRCLLSGRLEKQVAFSSSFPHGLIHERRDSVIVVPGDEFGECSCVKLAAGGLQP